MLTGSSLAVSELTGRWLRATIVLATGIDDLRSRIGRAWLIVKEDEIPDLPDSARGRVKEINRKITRHGNFPGGLAKLTHAEMVDIAYGIIDSMLEFTPRATDHLRS